MQTSSPRPFGLLALAVVGALIVGGVATYVLFLRGDNVAPLTLSTPSPTAGATTGPVTTGDPASPVPAGPTATPGSAITLDVVLAGAWSVVDGSIVGYRVREKLADLPAESDAVGRTDDVTGSMAVLVDGETVTVTSASFEADLTTLTSDNGRRDSRIKTSGLESSRFPTSTFVLAEPVIVEGDILGGVVLEATLVGDLTLHGQTRRVSIPVQARLTAGTIEVVGALTFPFADFGMTPPNIAGFVSVEDDATLEFALVLGAG